MKTALIIGLLVLLPVLLGVGLMASGVLGELLEALYTNDRDSWTKEGKPTIFTWTPPEDELNQGNISGTILSIKLLFRTPTWLPAIPNGNRVLKRLRMLSILNFVTLIAMFFLLQLLLGHLPSA
jgi:hypothetical protein